MSRGVGKGPGRPTLITPELIAKVRNAMANGYTRRDAAQLAGVLPATMASWICRSSYPRASQELRDLAAAVEAGEGLYRMRLEKVVLDAAIGTDKVPGDPKLALELLRMRFPQEFPRAGGGGVTVGVQATADADGNVQIGVGVRVDDDDLDDETRADVAAAAEVMLQRRLERQRAQRVLDVEPLRLEGDDDGDDDD